MKSEFKAKFLQHMIGRKDAEKGFTLIELLVVIIIIGILAAIALPSFLNQAAKAKQSEAKSYVGSVNRAQQAYRIENASFAGAVTALEIGLSTSTATYAYTITPGTGVSTSTVFTAVPTDTSTLRGFAGGVIVLSSGQTEAVACQNTKVRAQATTDPIPTLNAAGGSSCAGHEPMK